MLRRVFFSCMEYKKLYANDFIKNAYVLARIVCNYKWKGEGVQVRNMLIMSMPSPIS